MVTETLTAEERRALATLGQLVEGPKALRIIDAHAAERAALVERAERAERQLETISKQAPLAFERAESERNALAATLERVRVRAETVSSVWEAMGELTSYLIDGTHMVDVDDVRRVFERAALAGGPAPEGGR